MEKTRNKLFFHIKNPYTECMKRKVRFLRYDGYWVAEADNGAVSQGKSLEECRENIKDAILELESYKKVETPQYLEEFYTDIEVHV